MVRSFKPQFALGLAVLVAWSGVLFGVNPVEARQVLRIGHFPNITHVQALVAHGLARQGKGWFERRLGSQVDIQWLVYNAGPSAMEALFARSLDLTFVGPSPALNAYARSGGSEVRMLAGAANGGAGLVVQAESNLKLASDFRGKRIATPQLGNTQDIAARHWLRKGGLKVTQTGGDVHVLPTANSDQLLLFKQKQVDAVWTVEPWLSAIEVEAGGRVLFEETDAVTTVLVARAEFLRAEGVVVRQFLRAYEELTAWILNNPDEAEAIIRQELAAETRANMSIDILRRARKRVVLTNELSIEKLKEVVTLAQAVGFLRNMPDMSRLIQAP